MPFTTLQQAQDALKKVQESEKEIDRLEMMVPLMRTIQEKITKLSQIISYLETSKQNDDLLSTDETDSKRKQSREEFYRIITELKAQLTEGSQKLLSANQLLSSFIEESEDMLFNSIKQEDGFANFLEAAKKTLEKYQQTNGIIERANNQLDLFKEQMENAASIPSESPTFKR